MRTFFELVEQIKKDYGVLDQDEFAEKIGTSSENVTNWKRRGIPDKFLLKAKEDTGNDYSWIHESIKLSAKQSNRNDFVLVPRYNVEGSAGGGAIVENEEVLEYLSFRKEWIRNSLRIGESVLAVINVKGDSMEPRLRDGDVVLLDMSAKSIEDNAIYALQFNGGLSIKRVQRFMSGAIEIISDNKTYKPESLTPDQAESVKVVGRVVWAGGKV